MESDWWSDQGRLLMLLPIHRHPYTCTPIHVSIIHVKNSPREWSDDTAVNTFCARKGCIPFLFPAPTWHLATTCNSSSTGSDSLFWLLRLLYTNVPQKLFLKRYERNINLIMLEIMFSSPMTIFSENIFQESNID